MSNRTLIEKHLSADTGQTLYRQFFPYPNGSATRTMFGHASPTLHFTDLVADGDDAAMERYHS